MDSEMNQLKDYREQYFGWIKDNDPRTRLEGSGHSDVIQTITKEQWEEIGRDVSNNTHLEQLQLCFGALNDEKMSYLFSGLMGSSSIKRLLFHSNGCGTAGVMTMVPFLQNANNLKQMDLDGNKIQSKGFNFLIRAMHDGPIEELSCRSCGIESIEIELEQFPRKLKKLNLSCNNINADGCRGIAKLLQREDSTLTHLDLDRNKIDDEGVAILVDALHGNTSLMRLCLFRNDGITKEGLVMLLKLVNDISSVKATLQSHHVLSNIGVINISSTGASEDIRIQQLINMTTNVNKNCIGNSQAAGREKVIGTQLFSVRRAELAELQRVKPQSVFSEINPLHLPEVLSLVGRRHGQDELYAALKLSVSGVISTVNRRRCIMQQLAFHKAKLAQELAYYLAKVNKLRTELAGIDAGEGDAAHVKALGTIVGHDLEQ